MTERNAMVSEVFHQIALRSYRVSYFSLEKWVPRLDHSGLVFFFHAVLSLLVCFRSFLHHARFTPNTFCTNCFPEEHLHHH